MIQEAGISLCGNFFIGFPGETSASIEATYDLLTKCDFTTLFLSAFVVERSAEVFRNRERYGLEVSADGRWWRHPTMDSDRAAAETEDLFVRLAHDDRLRTVLWVVQWRFARLFPALVRHAHRPEVWAIVRLMQKGVADEIAFSRHGGSEAAHEGRQEKLWKQVMQCEILLEGG
jgi:hypothetical protein